MVETLLGVQIISFAFAAFMAHNAFTHYKKGNVSKKEFMLWEIIWVVFCYFALFPRVLDPILAKLFITRAMDLLMIVAFMILAYIGVQNHVGVKSLQKQIEQLVRKNTLTNAKKK